MPVGDVVILAPLVMVAAFSVWWWRADRRQRHEDLGPMPEPRTPDPALPDETGRRPHKRDGQADA